MPASGKAAACSKVSDAGRRQLIRWHAHQFRERPRGEPEHVLAHVKVRHIGSRALDHPGEIHAQDGVPGMAEPSREPDEERGPTHHVPVAREERRGTDADEHLTGTRLRPVKVLELEDVRGTVSTVGDRLHPGSRMTGVDRAGSRITTAVSPGRRDA